MKVCIAKFPNIKNILPNDPDDLRVENCPIESTIARYCDFLCPGDSNVSIEQLIPANKLLLGEKILVTRRIDLYLFIDGNGISCRYEPLPK